MVNNEENTEKNKEEFLEGSENESQPKRKGRPKKIMTEISKEEISEIKEEAEPQTQTEENTASLPEANIESGKGDLQEEDLQFEKDENPADENIPEIVEEVKTEDVEENLEKDEQEVSIIALSEENVETRETEKTEVKEEEVKVNISTDKIKRKSNYQISLVDENHLRTRVLTNKLVGIVCSVKDKYSISEGLGDRQTNKIFIHPKEKPQEVEVMVSIGSLPVPVELKDEPKEHSVEEKIEKESNYQISLVDENLLRIVIVTEKSVSIDCSVKDEDVHTDGSAEIQANKIYIHPKEKHQEVEVIVSIGNAVLESDTAMLTEAKEQTQDLQKGKLIPNPLVANLIHKFSDYPGGEDNGIPKTAEEKLEEKLGPKNPWRIYKEMMRRNLIAGFIGAVLVYIITVSVFYSFASKKNNNADVVEAPRLIVMQDLPENQFQQQNVEDPNKPPEEVKASDDATNTNKIPPIAPKKIKPPRVIAPQKQKTDTSTAIDKELDSLRKVNNNITSKEKNPGDSMKNISGNFPIPDSVMKVLKENEVGLVGKFPPNWKQIDSRAININENEFSGVLLVDTAVKRKEEALTMSIQLDKNGEYWNQYKFKNVFAEDSLKNVIYNIEPKLEGDQMYYRFYISGMAHNIYVASFINKEHFDKHKAEIEQVIRTIRIQKPATPPGK